MTEDNKKTHGQKLMIEGAQKMATHLRLATAMADKFTERLEAGEELNYNDFAEAMEMAEALGYGWHVVFEAVFIISEMIASADTHATNDKYYRDRGYDRPAAEAAAQAAGDDEGVDFSAVWESIRSWKGEVQA